MMRSGQEKGPVKDSFPTVNREIAAVKVLAHGAPGCEEGGMTSMPDRIYKIATRQVFEAALEVGTFPGMPIDIEDGYVHFSTAAQLAETLRLHFAGQSDLVLFAVRGADLPSPIVWEPSRGGQLFPHLYGELPMSAMAEHAAIAVAEDGAVSLPEWVK
jgi:uncharacterized protein (DUF952 family)